MALFESKSDFTKVVVWTAFGLGLAGSFFALNGISWVRSIADESIQRALDEQVYEIRAVTSEVNARLEGEIKRLQFELRETRAALPSGLVAAFSTDAGCPEGWRPFELAVGRVIIGSGDQVGPTGRNVPHLSTGGEEVSVLTIENLPKGAIGEIETTRIRGVATNEASQFSAVDDVRTFRIGGGQPINNLPPYVALQFCQRE